MQTINLYNEFFDDWSEKWFQYILDNPDKHWNYNQLNSNPNITWEIVQDNPDKHWNYNWLSLNPNITWEIVQANPDKLWNYRNLSLNEMNKSREKYICFRFQEWFKRSELKAELMASVWHPRNFEKFKYLDPETFGEEF